MLKILCWDKTLLATKLAPPISQNVNMNQVTYGFSNKSYVFIERLRKSISYVRRDPAARSHYADISQQLAVRVGGSWEYLGSFQ